MWLDTAFEEGCGWTHAGRSSCLVADLVCLWLGVSRRLADHGRLAAPRRRAVSSLSSPEKPLRLTFVVGVAAESGAIGIDNAFALLCADGSFTDCLLGETAEAFF